MIYQVAVDVRGDTFVKVPYELDIDEYKIKVDCNEGGKVTQLTIQKRVSNYDNYIPVANLSKTGHNPYSVYVPENPHYDDII